MNYLKVSEIAELWNVSNATVARYCAKGRVTGAKKMKKNWFIPENAQKPIDLRKSDKKENKFTFIDLFCGIGGFHQAMAALGGKCVFACDINDVCREVYKKNYKTEGDDLIIGSDIKKAIKEGIIPQFDVLCGGFPCQTFSKAGKRNGFKVVETENGEKDDRGQLFFRIIDILKVHPECKYVILENVRNLADNETNWGVVCEELRKQGFIITEEPIIESPHKFGIPQVRDRVYILGVKRTAVNSDDLREAEKITREMLHIDKYYRECENNSIPLLLDEIVDSDYFVKDEIAEILDIWEEFLQNVKGIKSPFWLHKAGLGIDSEEEYKSDSSIGYMDMPKWKQKLLDKSRKMYVNNREFIDGWVENHNMLERILIHKKFEWNASKSCKSIKDGIIQIRQSGVRVKNPDYFPSLVAMNNTPIVWDGKAKKYRYLSPKEAAKLQSFKKDFVFHELDSISYRQLGNSVNVRILEILTSELFKLNNEDFKETNE